MAGVGSVGVGSGGVGQALGISLLLPGVGFVS